MLAPSLRRNFAWSFAGNATFALSQWLIVIAIAKLGSQRLVGDWTLALAITGPVFIFFQFKLRQVQATDARNEHVWAEYFGLRIAGVLVASVVTVSIAFVGLAASTAYVVAAIAMVKAIDALSDVAYGHQQKHERMRAVGISLAGRGVTSAVAAAFILWSTGSLGWTALAIAAVFASWLVWDLRGLQLGPGERRAPTTNRMVILPLARRVLPLGFVTAIGSLQVNIPRYFLEASASREELGVFGSLSYLLVAGAMVVAAMATAAAPRMSRSAARGEWSQFRRQVLWLVALGTGLGVAGVVMSIVLGEAVLRFVYSDAYAAHSDILVWLALTAALTWAYVFLGTGMDAMRKYTVQPVIHVVSSAVIAGASALLVPAHGMTGACWAMLIGHGVESIMYLFALTSAIRTEERATMGGAA